MKKSSRKSTLCSVMRKMFCYLLFLKCLCKFTAINLENSADVLAKF